MTENNECNIRVEGRRGTWYVVDKCQYAGEWYWVLESEVWGDEAEWIAVKEGDFSQSFELDEVGYN